MSDFIDQKPDLSTTLLGTLRKFSRERSVPVKIVAISFMFRLLEKFAEEKNSAAPLIYKSLIFTAIESSMELPLREHYLYNFSSLFSKVPTIPIGLLVEPLIKQMQSEKAPFQYCTFDFDFF